LQMASVEGGGPPFLCLRKDILACISRTSGITEE
jgi:hypothetical protein